MLAYFELFIPELEVYFASILSEALSRCGGFIVRFGIGTSLFL